MPERTNHDPVMTAEEIVKAKWPRAECIDVCGPGFIHLKYIITATGFNLGKGLNEAEAWEAAATRIAKGNLDA